jgi:hypothetical protein
MISLTPPSVEQRELLGRRLLISAAVLVVLMAIIRNHFYVDFEKLVLISPLVAVALVAAFLPNRATLGIAAVFWLYGALWLTEVFNTPNMDHETPELRRLRQSWDYTADAALIGALCAGAAGLSLLWARQRAKSPK